MSLRSLAIPLALLAFLAPLASAHQAGYDPLVVELHAFLAPEGAVTIAEPAGGAVPFPAANPATASSLRFAFTAPVRFAPAGAFVVNVTLRAEQAVLTGDGIEVAIEPGATPQRAALPPLMAPGETATVSLTVQGAASYARGDEVGILVRPLAPALADGALVLLLGGEAPSTLALHDMRVPSVADLELQEAELREFLLESETFAPPAGAVANVFAVGHAAVTPLTTPGFSANGTYVVFRGDEPDEAAKAHEQLDRQARVDAAHAFLVGSQLVRVHPGVGVAIAVTQDPTTIRCVAHCPPGGWTQTIRTQPAGGASATPEDRPSSLVPPPRDTSGIPVSQDDGPEEKGVPLSPAVALVAVGAVALAASRRR